MTVNSVTRNSSAWPDREGAPASGEPAGGTGHPVDLVLEGGGVRGIGLAGALLTLSAAGYRFQRVAGTSAGSIVAALVAALGAAGQPLSRLNEIMQTINYPEFMNRPALGDVELAERLVSRHGLYDGGAYLRKWLGGQLEDIGITKFSQLRLSDSEADSNLRDSQKYSLVVCVTDVTRRALARLPWDYPRYGLNPDDQLIVDACIPSMSIPVFFQPYELNAVTATVDGVEYPAEKCTWVDGGVLDVYPVDIFDRTDGRPARWQTIGIKLEAKQPIMPPPHEKDDVVAELIDIVKTAIDNGDRNYVGREQASRTVFVNAADVSTTDFNITPAQQAQLYKAGQEGAQAFLSANLAVSRR